MFCPEGDEIDDSTAARTPSEAGLALAAYSSSDRLTSDDNCKPMWPEFTLHVSAWPSLGWAPVNKADNTP